MYAESYANCATSHPTPVVTILGTNDFESNYDGITYQGTLYFHSSDEGNALWIEKNGLLDSPEVTEMPNLSTNDGSSVERYRWTDAEDCIELVHYKVNGGGHDWPGSFGNMDIVSHEVIWDHLKEYNMEGQMSCATSRINDLETQEWKISPNPTSMALNVTFGEGETPDWFQIFNVRGQVCMESRSVQGAHWTIDISGLKPGLHLIRTARGTQSFVVR